MISLARIARQVEREGRRWRLSPLIRDGKVLVVEYVPEIGIIRPGRVIIPYRSPRVVVRLGEDSEMDAWSHVLRRRLNRTHTNWLKTIRDLQAKRQAAEQRVLEQVKKDARARAEAKMLRSRTVFLPGMMPLEPGIFRGGR